MEKLVRVEVCSSILSSEAAQGSSPKDSFVASEGAFLLAFKCPSTHALIPQQVCEAIKPLHYDEALMLFLVFTAIALRKYRDHRVLDVFTILVSLANFFDQRYEFLWCNLGAVVDLLHDARADTDLPSLHPVSLQQSVPVDRPENHLPFALPFMY
jgi:hypothetical protein